MKVDSLRVTADNHDLIIRGFAELFGLRGCAKERERERERGATVEPGFLYPELAIKIVRPMIGGQVREARRN